MDISAIKALLVALDGSAVQSLTYEDREIKLALSKGAAVMQVAPAPDAPRPQAACEQTLSLTEERGILVRSPVVGTLYRSREPGQEPLVSAGSRVKKGQALCLIEAMKAFSEIIAPCDGAVTQVLFEDGALAEFDLPLFQIEEAT